MPKRHAARWFAAVAAALAVAAGCAGMRYAAYPPEFTWLPDQQVEGPMRLLARDVSELDGLLRQTNTPGPAGRARVLALLGRMEGSAATLEMPGTVMNHPMLEKQLPRFRAALIQARTAVEAEPPSYFSAGRVSGSCLLCHAAR